MIDISTKPYIQITRPFLKWLLPFFVVTSGAIAAGSVFPLGLGLLRLIPTLILFCFVIQGICIRVTNDIFDVEVDKLSPDDDYARFRPIALGLMTRTQGTAYAGIGYVIALIFSYYLGPVIFTITALTLMGQFLYSAPPTRLKRFFPVSNIMIGLFYGGAFFLAGWSLYQPINTLAISTAVFLIIFVSIFSITKDYSDVEGDMSKGIRTLPVVFGLERAGKINTGLIALFYVILGLFILAGLFPLYSALVFITMLFFAPGVYRLYRLDGKTSPGERRKIMNMTMPVGFLVFILLGISLALG